MKKKKKGLSGLIRKIAKKTRRLFRLIIKTLTPDPIAWTGASVGIAITILALSLILVVLYVKYLGIVVSSIAVIYFLLTGVLAALGLFLILKIIKSIPSLYRWVLTGAVAILIIYWTGTIQGKLVILAITILSASFIAGPLTAFICKGWRRNPLKNNILNIIVLTTGLAGLAFGSYWLLKDGVKDDIPENAALKSEFRPSHIGLPDPSLEGNNTVFEIFYGSGKDKHRNEYGENVNIKTDSVDGSHFIKGWDKFHGWARTKYWGFDEKSLPLNGRVWYPGGNGPFPLVLIVHGNHMDRDYSDPGYEYLGRLMASRGFIFVSVDENFLNGAWSNIFKSLEEENDCRAWIMLKHLELWHRWNKDSLNPFYGKIDTENIALIGHSRGGEAVAIAAAFNQLPYYPDDATIRFDFGYNIRSIIAIAPVDGQYKPAKVPTFFENVSYFVLQGSHDMDMQSYHGARQFQRIKFTDSDFHVKTGLYIWGANHGQFNTVWRRNDIGYPGIALYNKRQIMPEEDQKKIAKVYISAFLEATLHKTYEYLPLFRDYRSGINWLPETIFLNQYEDTEYKIICSFEEDIDLTTTTVNEGQISAENLTVWKENMVPLKWGQQDTRAVYTGWNLEDMDSLTGSYMISIKPENEMNPGLSGYLVFSLAQSKESSNPNPPEKEKNNQINENKNISGRINSENSDTLKVMNEKEKKKEAEDQKDTIDFSIVLMDSDGNSARLPLSHYAFIQPQLEAKIMKADFMTKTDKSETVFQTFFFLLKDFQEESTAFNPLTINKIKFVFDRTEEGVVVIDDIGFWKSGSD